MPPIATKCMPHIVTECRPTIATECRLAIGSECRLAIAIYRTIHSPAVDAGFWVLGSYSCRVHGTKCRFVFRAVGYHVQGGYSYIYRVMSIGQLQSSKWKFEFTGLNQIFEYILYIHVHLNKNWQIYWSEQSFTDLGLEDLCSSWRMPL